MWMLYSRDVHTALHYLDDCLVLGPLGQSVCEDALHTTLALCAEIVPGSRGKDKGSLDGPHISGDRD